MDLMTFLGVAFLMVYLPYSYCLHSGMGPDSESSDVPSSHVIE